MPDWEALERLQAEIEGSDSWPIKREEKLQKKIRVWQALYAADQSWLKDHVGWTNKRKSDYVCDPLPQRIATAFADLIFGADPKFFAAGTGEKDDEGNTLQGEDQDNLTNLIEENDLPSELQRAAAMVSAEGETWWRIVVDETQSYVPVIEFHSRLSVIPLLEGKTPVAVAFVSELSGYKDSESVYRLIEYQAIGIIQNVLYKGTDQELGNPAPLDEHYATEDLADNEGTWQHDLDEMLCGRVVNGFGRGHHCGRSDYESVKEMLFALNEATSIAHDNVKLTAKKRVIIPDTYLDRQGRPPLDDDVIIRSEVHRDPDKPDAGWAQLEWEFDAEALIAYTRDLTNKIITRVGLTAQFVDANSDDGTADSGTALRLRMLPASRTSEGKARWWDDALPKLLAIAAQVDALDEGAGGFGHDWSDATALPTVERSDPFPRDQVEDATMVTTLKASSLISNRTSLEIIFPDWTDKRIQEELDRLATEAAEALKQQQEMFGAPGGFQQAPDVPLEEEPPQ